VITEGSGEGFPHTHQASHPPGLTPTRPPTHQVPDDLQPHHQPRATLPASQAAPASARSPCRRSRPEAIHRPLVLPRLPERPGSDSLVTARLTRRCGPLSEATTARIQALPLQQLEALADALLDFQGPADLATWLAAHS